VAERSSKRIAIVGGGVSGLVAGHLLAPNHDVTLFEAADRLGGHTHTVPVEIDSRRFLVDVGFVVFNERTYPHFTELLHRLDVPTQPTRMSFSVCAERDGIEYDGGSLMGLFAQWRNALRPAFVPMLVEIVRFNRVARRTSDACATPLGEFLREGGFSRALREWYVLPMVACIWSAPVGRAENFPIGPLLAFLRRHGLLDLSDRPQWRVVRGGAARYVDALVASFRDRIRLGEAVRAVRRVERGVVVETVRGTSEPFDEAVIAVHGDEVLTVLADPTSAERAAFAAFHYVENEVVLHTDERLLPRRARACWNALVPIAPDEPVRVTYDMNLLQGLEAPRAICVTLNRGDVIAPACVVRRLRYRHPMLQPETLVARGRVEALSGADRVHFCGAYLGYGFHEDGVRSAMDVARRIDAI
jgi:hypothetical protein